MDKFKRPTRQTIKGRGKKKRQKTKEKRRKGQAGQKSIPGLASLTDGATGQLLQALVNRWAFGPCGTDGQAATRPGTWVREAVP
jgi:hypothetical protein